MSTSPLSWTVYHGDPEGQGVAAGVTGVNVSTPAWTSPTLDGQLYGEPLVSGARVYVATENDTVDALSVATGAVVWSTHLGTPVPSGSLPCGDISPTVGITGTPVIDEARGELFVVADELINGSPAHQLVGSSTATGKTELSQDVDPAGSKPAAILQRTGLTIDAGRVVFGYGGNYGDCSTYHGWVMSVPEAGGTPAAFEVDSGPGESQGAVWMGGAAPVVDAGGNIWVEAGQRVRDLAEPCLRRQRLRARALTDPHAGAVLRTHRRGPSDNAQRSRPVDRHQRCSATARWWRPANRASSTC